MTAKQEPAYHTKCKTSHLLAALGRKIGNDKDEEIITTGGDISSAPS